MHLDIKVNDPHKMRPSQHRTLFNIVRDIPAIFGPMYTTVQSQKVVTASYCLLALHGSIELYSQPRSLSLTQFNP